MPLADAWRADHRANEDFMDEAVRKRLIEAMARAVIAHAEELTELDRQIGDGGVGPMTKRLSDLYAKRTATEGIRMVDR